MKLKELFAVFFATFLLIILGDGVVANVVLGPRLAGSEASFNWNTIAIGWAFAVILSGLIAGADNNPAITLANAFRGATPWAKVVPYLIAEFAGAFVGAFGVYLAYRDGLVAAGLPNIYTSGAGSYYGPAGTSGGPVGQYSLLTASITEFIGTVILMWGVLATSDRRNAALSKAGPFVVGGVVLAIGLCLGGPSGYAINPARDLGPRLFGMLAGTNGLFDGLYWLIPPVLIPFLAAPIGGYLFDLFFASEKVPQVAPSLQVRPGSTD